MLVSIFIFLNTHFHQPYVGVLMGQPLWHTQLIFSLNFHIKYGHFESIYHFNFLEFTSHYIFLKLELKTRCILISYFLCCIILTLKKNCWAVVLTWINSDYCFSVFEWKQLSSLLVLLPLSSTMLHTLWPSNY